MTKRRGVLGAMRLVAIVVLLGSLTITPARGAESLERTYRCTSYNVSGGGGSCRTMSPLILRSDGTYQNSSTRGSWRMAQRERSDRHDPRPTTTCLVSAAMVLILAGAFIAPAAARIVTNTIDPVAIVTDDGRHLVVTGPITCAAGERAYLRATVTQRTTGAVAEGRTLVNCTGDTQHWEVHAPTQGKSIFQEGPAIAVALGRSSDRGVISDAHQWLVDITLVAE